MIVVYGHFVLRPNRTLKVVPSASLLSTVILPFMLSTMRWAMESPKP